jgi:hypothetical protein
MRSRGGIMRFYPKLATDCTLSYHCGLLSSKFFKANNSYIYH